MKHGKITERHIQVSQSTFTGTLSGGVDFSVEYCDTEVTVTTRYCKYCNKEVSNKGNWLIGSIKCSVCGNDW